MRYAMRHVTSYQYAQPVVTSFHRVYLRPRSHWNQHVIEHQVVVNHGQAAMGENSQLLVDSHFTNRTDYLGNECGRIELIRPYSSLTITSWSLVEVQRQVLATDSDSTLIGQYSHASEAAEFRFNSTHIHRHDDLAAYAAHIFVSGKTVLEAVDQFSKKIFTDCTYDPKATDVATSPLTILKNKRGVCQDFAHLAIACLRSLGIPAMYVSGYLETAPPPGKKRLIGADASHAWFAVHDPKLGWIHADPTNGCLIGQRHIITAVGRDFADVSPVTGIIYGGGTQSLSVAVDVVPECDWSQSELIKSFPFAPSLTQQQNQQQ